jgi:hypothetical protein
MNVHELNLASVIIDFKRNVMFLVDLGLNSVAEGGSESPLLCMGFKCVI